MTLSAALLSITAIAALQQDTSAVKDTVVVLDEFVVTGARAAEVQRIEQPLAVSWATPDLAQRASGSLAVHLLQDLAGVHIQQTSAGQGAVVLRGMVGNQVLLLVNGVPMNNATYRDGPGQYLASIDPETIERIEIVRGPASVLYGSDAQGGVVNLITATHRHAGARSARAAGSVSSADGGARARVSAGLAGVGWNVALGGTFMSVGNLHPGDGLAAQTPTDFTAEGLDAAAGFRFGNRHSLVGVVQHFAMHDVPRYDRYVTFRAPEPGSDAEHLFQPQTRQLAFARYRYAPERPGLMRLEATVSLTTQREGRDRVRLLDTGDPADERTHWRDDVYSPGASVVGSSVFMVRHRPVMLQWGADYYHDMLDSDGWVETISTGIRTPLEIQTADGSIQTGNFPDGANADRFGVFLATDVQLTDRVKLSAGARWSRFRNEAMVGVDLGGLLVNTSSDLTGQLGMVVALAKPWRLALRVAEGFRAPNLYDLTRVGPVPGGMQLPNPGVRPEHSVSGEAGIRYMLSTTAFEFTAYYTRVTDFIDRVPGAFQGDTLFNGERVFLGQNIGTARIWGFEAQGVRELGPVRVSAGLAYTRGEQEAAAGVEEPMSKIPPLGGHTSVRYTPPAQRWWIEYSLRWATRQDRLGSRDLLDPRIPKPEGTPGYAVHGVRATAKVTPQLTVSAGLGNLADALYRTHASGVDAAGRHVWVGASWLGGL
jgi:iron complex outermembrane receptor protein/hemoglobin/transferrin/lactoferrin receptor protein